MRHKAGLVLFPGLGPRDEVEPVPRPEPDLAPAGGRARAPRYLILHLPAFPLERCGYLADELAVCVDEVKSATRIVALTPAARIEGLGVGMTAAEARALVPEVLLEPRDLVGEAIDREGLLEAFAGFSDRLAPWAETDLLLEVSVTAHLFGGEQALLTEVGARAEQLGHACSLAIADDPLAAAAVAAFGTSEHVVPVGQGARALAALPIAALAPSEALATSLEVLGIRRIGTWARLDPASVSGRFGAEGVRLHRIARGQAASGLPWDVPAQGPVAERVVLGGPTITLEPIHFVLPGLLARVADALAERDAMAVRVAVHLVLERGPAHVMRVRVGRPTREIERLDRVVRSRLERIRLDAPAVELMIEVEEQTLEAPWQPGLLDRTEIGEELPDLLARMADALGPAALVSPVPTDAWCPEEGWKERVFQPGCPLPPFLVHRKAKIDPVAQQRAFETDGPRPRPAILLPRPQRIELQERGGRPIRIRRAGRWEPVGYSEGPERIEGAWWRDDGGFCRDYWVLQLNGSVAWVYGDDQGRWWLHGWFD